jgi:hypothetical protein
MPTHFQKLLKECDTTFLDAQIPGPSDKCNWFINEVTFKIDITISQFDAYLPGNMGQFSTEMVIKWSREYKEL